MGQGSPALVLTIHHHYFLAGYTTLLSSPHKESLSHLQQKDTVSPHQRALSLIKSQCVFSQFISTMDTGDPVTHNTVVETVWLSSIAAWFNTLETFILLYMAMVSFLFWQPIASSQPITVCAFLWLDSSHSQHFWGFCLALPELVFLVFSVWSSSLLVYKQITDI